MIYQLSEALGLISEHAEIHGVLGVSNLLPEPDISSPKGEGSEASTRCIEVDKGVLQVREFA